jgi:regulator of protease activity HflC (stomatin/prohibitin superfamily)
MSNDAWIFLGFMLTLGGVGLAWSLLTRLRVEVEDGECVLVTRFGRLARTINEPGFHWLLDRAMPWVGLRSVSTRQCFRLIRDIAVNDASGTTVVVDVFLELRIVDAARATFGITDWERALKNLVSHAVISALGNREFFDILRNRNELGQVIERDIRDETERWGLRVELVMIRNVSLLPEVSQQLFQSIAARLERAKAEIEEEGRQRIALLEAKTQAEIAAIVAEARGQYPAAVGRALSALKSKPRVLQGYNTLYELSMLRPHRTVAFHGFADHELKLADAAMLSPPSLNGEAAE